MIHINLNRSWATYAVALLFCMTGGCVRSIQPILTDKQVITDDHVLGSWVGSDGKGSCVVQAADDHKTYKVLYTDEDGKKANLLVQLGKVGDMTIAQITIDDPAPGASDVYKAHLLPLYSFMVVKQTTPHLIFKMMQPDWLTKYVDAHPTELATIRLDQNDLLVSASTADFQAFLLRHAKDDGVFGDDAVLVRSGDPSTRPTTTPVGAHPPPAAK